MSFCFVKTGYRNIVYYKSRGNRKCETSTNKKYPLRTRTLRLANQNLVQDNLAVLVILSPSHPRIRNKFLSARSSQLLEEINFQICKVIFCLSLGDICREQIEVIFSLCWESIFLKPDSSAFLLAGARTSDGRQFCFSLPPSTFQIYSKKMQKTQNGARAVCSLQHLYHLHFHQPYFLILCAEIITGGCTVVGGSC